MFFRAVSHVVGSALILSAHLSGVGCEMESGGVAERLEIPLCWLQCERVAFSSPRSCLHLVPLPWNSYCFLTCLWASLKERLSIREVCLIFIVWLLRSFCFEDVNGSVAGRWKNSCWRLSGGD